MTFRRDGGAPCAAAVLALCTLGPAVQGQDLLPGDVLSTSKISALEGGLGGPLDDADGFGSSLAVLGDVNGDGIDDIAVGAPFDDDGGSLGAASDVGAVWILFLDTDGTVQGEQKVSASSGGFGGSLANGDRFGNGVTGLGDLDGNGVPDLAVGAPFDGGMDFGATWVLFLAADGTVIDEQKIDRFNGGFGGTLSPFDGFGWAVAALGDLDGDDLPELAVSAPFDDDGGSGQGAVWILFLDAAGTVQGEQKISDNAGGLVQNLQPGARFGSGLAGLGDIDKDGVPDLAVGADELALGGVARGAVFALRLAADGTVAGEVLVNGGGGAFIGPLDDGDRFGASVTSIADMNKDGRRDLVVGAPGDDDESPDTGAVWIVYLSSGGAAFGAQKISATQSGFGLPLESGDGLGSGLTALDDLDGDGSPDLVVGAPGDDDGGADRGASYVLTLAGAQGKAPFLALTGALEGRPGQVTVVKPQGTDGDDAIDEPVVVVPRENGDQVETGGVGAGVQDLELGGGSVGFTFDVGENPQQAIHADFDDDGFDDVVTANKGTDDLSLLLGQDLPGEPPFAAQIVIPLTMDSAPIGVETGDFNNDTVPDAAVAGAAGVTVLLSNGSGSLAFASFTPVAFLTDLTLSDVDDDGNLDVITTSGALAAGPGLEDGIATVLLGDGLGGLTVASTFASGQALASVLVGDLDGDTLDDAFVVVHGFDDGPGGTPQGRIELFVGDGAGNFAPSGVFTGFDTPSADGIHPTFGALGDANEDGVLDAIYTPSENISHAPDTFAAEQPPFELTILLSDGNGGFDANLLGTAYSGKGVAPVLDDFAPSVLDGHIDCVLVWYQDLLAGQGAGEEQFQTFIALLVGDGTGNFFDPAPNQFLTGDEPGDGDVGDVDGGGGGDGAPAVGLDLVLPAIKDNALMILLGDGTGAIATTQVVPDIDDLDPLTLPPGALWEGGPRRVLLGDMDNDGNLDAVVYNAWEDSAGLNPTVFASLSLLLGDGLGGFAKTQYLPLPRGGEHALSDVTGDGNLDVVVVLNTGAGSGDALRVFIGFGNGTIGTGGFSIPLPPGGRLSGGLAATQLLGTPPADLITTVTLGAGGQGGLMILENGAVPLVGTIFPLPTSWPDGVASLDVGDADGDGLLDLAIGAVDGRLLLALGQAGGGFELADLSAEAGSVGGGALRLGDLNGDPALDLVSSNASQGGSLDQAFVRTLIGDGSGDFDVQSVPGLSSVGLFGALRPILADMNSDGATDVVLVHGTSDTLSILLNQKHAFTPFGNGKVGSGGFFPRLAGLGYSTPGGAIEFVLDDALGGSAAGLLYGTGVSAAGVLAMQEILSVVGLVTDGVPGVPGDGGATLAFEIPPDPGLAGLAFTFQAMILDRGAGPQAPVAASASNGVVMEIVP